MSGGGGWGKGGSPPQNRNFFFFSKSLYLLETKVAEAKNVWGGHPKSKFFFVQIFLCDRDKGKPSKRCLGGKWWKEVRLEPENSFLG
jgi:hypothetical protein